MKFDATTMMGVALGKRRELTGRQALVDAMIGQAVGGNQALALVLTDRLNRRHASSEAPTTGSDAEPKPRPKPKPKPNPVAVAGSIEGISEEIVEAMEVLIEKHGTDIHEFLKVFLGEVMKARKEELERMMDAIDSSSGMHRSDIEVPSSDEGVPRQESRPPGEG